MHSIRHLLFLYQSINKSLNQIIYRPFTALLIIYIMYEYLLTSQNQPLCNVPFPCIIFTYTAMNEGIDFNRISFDFCPAAKQSVFPCQHNLINLPSIPVPMSIIYIKYSQITLIKKTTFNRKKTKESILFQSKRKKKEGRRGERGRGIDAILQTN